jgi:hypothetical protein
MKMAADDTDASTDRISVALSQHVRRPSVHCFYRHTLNQTDKTGRVTKDIMAKLGEVLGLWVCFL